MCFIHNLQMRKPDRTANEMAQITQPMGIRSRIRISIHISAKPMLLLQHTVCSTATPTAALRTCLKNMGSGTRWLDWRPNSATTLTCMNY